MWNPLSFTGFLDRRFPLQAMNHFGVLILVLLLVMPIAGLVWSGSSEGPVKAALPQQQLGHQKVDDSVLLKKLNKKRGGNVRVRRQFLTRERKCTFGYSQVITSPDFRPQMEEVVKTSRLRPKEKRPCKKKSVQCVVDLAI